MTFALYAAAAGLVVFYLALVSRRLNQSRFRPQDRLKPFPSDEELLEESANWADIDVLDNSGVEKPTGQRYLVTGACGSFGPWLVQIMHRRGERHIYCLDLAPLPASLQGLEGVHFIKCNLSSAEAVDQAFSEARPDVVFHVAANIRFWERSSFTYRLSKTVNIDGTVNVIDALSKMPASSEKLLVYCSSAAVLLPEPLILRFGTNFQDYASTFTLSDERDIPDHHRAKHDYAVSKTEADRLVRVANGRNGLRTGVLRPGMTVCSPNDQVFGSMIRDTVYPVLGASVAQNSINSQDLAIAFLLYEAALRERPQEVAGEAFLVTGDRTLWTWLEYTKVVQLFAQHNVTIFPVPALPLYILGHFIELVCTIRYYALLPAYFAMGWGFPSPHPKWMERPRLHHLQPAMWNTLLSDVDVDDTRARKVLGYRNRFSNAQTIRWIADTVENTQMAGRDEVKGGNEELVISLGLGQ